MGESAYYLEFLHLGAQVKVSAIDPETGIEVSIIAGKTATQDEMTCVAVEKLKRMIARRQAQSDEPPRPQTKGDKRGGILV